MSKVRNIQVMGSATHVDLESDAIAYAGYVPVGETGVMVIRFTSGASYVYTGVKVQHFMLLTMSESVGKAYHQFIRPNYSGTRMD